MQIKYEINMKIDKYNDRYIHLQFLTNKQITQWKKKKRADDQIDISPKKTYRWQTNT